MPTTRAISILVCSGLFVFSASVSSQTTIAGATAGGFQVSETGAAVYSVPIQVPPGIAGLTPKLSLVYSSQAGNGIAGMGWSLAGLSAIQRCPITPIQDGKRRGVQYDPNDAYCLDGQRLVSVNGAYGANNTEYRTERESFSRIVSYGVAGSGPAYFQVWTKAGLVMEYGNTADSRIEYKSTASDVRVYALNKISDLSTNYWTVSYSENTANGEFYATRIDYTGNATAAQAPTASVRMTYATRPDPIYTNVYGAPVRLTVRLTNVQTYVANSMVKDYRLAYPPTPGITGRSRLASVTECSGDGAQCFPPISFAWQEPSLTPQNFNWSGNGIGNVTWKLLDLFGDGKPVYWTANTDGNHYGTRRNPDASVSNWSWPVGYNSQWSFGDLFGEGRQLFYTHANGIHTMARMNADGTWTPYQWNLGFGLGDQGWQIGDIFGDGREVVWMVEGAGGGTHHAYRFNSDTSFESWTWPGVGYNSMQGLADLFGDGRKVWFTYSGNGNYSAARLNPDSTVEQLWYANGSWIGDGYKVADLFGDGRQVIYYTDRAGNHYATRLNPDGTLDNWAWSGGWAVQPNQSPCPGGFGAAFCNAVNAVNWRLADIFGDGRQLFYTRDQNGVHYATRLNPDGTRENFSWSGGYGSPDAAGGWDIGDPFGDGRSLYYRKDSGGAHYATRIASSKPDLLLSITNSLGHVTNFSYKPLTDSTVYAKSSGASYPAQDTQMPLYVVDSAVVANGIGANTNTTGYFYTGGRLHLTGGGFLGFSQFRATDTQLIKAETAFRQDYPFQGLTLSVNRTNTSTSVVLTGTTNTWTDTQYPASLRGKHHRADLTQSVQTSRELDGTTLPTLTASTTYDTYGNALTVTTSTGDGYTKATTNTYADTVNSTTWLLGRLKTSTVSSTIPAP